MNYFGIFIPNTLANNWNGIGTGYFLLANTEFNFDADVIGFEFFGTVAGSITVKIVSFGNLCSNYKSCADFATQTLRGDTLITVQTWSVNVFVGYNYVELIPTTMKRIPKGSMVFIDSYSFVGRLAIDISDQAYYSDFFVIGSSLTRLHSTINYRYYFKCLIKQPYYGYEFSTSMQFTQNGIQNFSLKLYGPSYASSELVGTLDVQISNFNFISSN